MALDLANGRLRLGNARINPLNQHRLRESLNKNTTLLQIMLLGGTYTDEVVEDLCAMIEKNTTLQLLQFAEEEFTDDGVSKLLRALCTNSSLEHLELRRCKVTDAVVNDLCLLSVQNSTLTTLQFHQAAFTDTGVSKLVRSLCGNTSLEILAFWESPLSDQVISDLCMCIDENKVMENLQFHSSRFTDSDLSKMLQSMRNNETLESLVFAKSELSDEVVPAMSSFLQENQVLKIIHFQEARFSDSGVSALLLSLIGNSRLIDIGFGMSQLSDAVIGDLSHLIKENHGLTHLKFSEAKFTDPGLITLLQALSNNLAMEKLSFLYSQLSDAVVLPMCRFLTENKVMKDLIFEDARFTDSGVTGIVQSLMQNHALEKLVFFHSQLTDKAASEVCQFIKGNNVIKCLGFFEERFTDQGLSALLKSLTLNSTLERFEFGGSLLTDAVISDLCTFVEDNRVIKDMEILHPAGDAFIPPLVRFLKHRAYIMRVKSIDRGQTECLMTQENDAAEPAFYHIMAGNGQVDILPRSEYLQAELMDLLKEHSVPSAVDILNNLLVLFVQKDKEAGFREALSERLQDVREDIATAHRIHTLHKAPEFVFHNDNSEWKTGLWVHTPEIGETGLSSTVGAILVDDDGKLYLTSSFHGNKFEKCQILNKYEGQCVAEVFRTSPLLDACLIEVQTLEGKTKHSPTLPAPHVEATVCGPYTGPNGDIARNHKHQRGQPRTAATSTVVSKYGITTYLTEGKLLYYNYTHPDPKLDISDALLVLSGYDEKFTAGGDSGAVIFRHSACADTHTDTVFCHEAVAMNCGGVVLGPQKVSVACRLDDVIEHFEAKLGKRLKLVGTRTNTLEEFLLG